MPRFCASCGSQVQDNAGFCPSCGKPVGQATVGGAAAAPAPAPAVASAPASGAMADNIAGLLAYITIIPAIIFLVMEPYNKKPFVRFHSFQCIFFSLAWMAFWFVLMFLGVIPYIGTMLFFLMPLLGLAGTVLWVVLLLKAYQGQMFKLPVIGDFAEKQSKVA